MVYNHILAVDGTYADVASLPLSHRRIRSELDHEVCERVYKVTKKVLEDAQIQNVQLVRHNYFTDAGVLRISKRICHINDGDIATFALTLSWTAQPRSPFHRPSTYDFRNSSARPRDAHGGSGRNRVADSNTRSTCHPPKFCTIVMEYGICESCQEVYSG
jgi:hypothetical protein